MIRFFVYGTLKKGYRNHTFLQSARFLGEHKTEPIYTLYNGSYPIVCRNGKTAISGEVYEVDDKSTILAINRLEGHISRGHQYNLYDIDVINTPFGEANIFVMNNCERKEIIESGKW